MGKQMDRGQTLRFCDLTDGSGSDTAILRFYQTYLITFRTMAVRPGLKVERIFLEAIRLFTRASGIMRLSKTF